MAASNAGRISIHNSSHPILGPLGVDSPIQVHGQIPMSNRRSSSLAVGNPGRNATVTQNVSQQSTQKPSDFDDPTIIDPSVLDQWTTQTNVSGQPYIFTPGKDEGKACHMDRLNLAAFRPDDGLITSPFGMTCRHANVKTMPEKLTRAFPSRQKEASSEPDFVFLCEPKANNYPGLYLMLTDFDPTTGKKGASDRTIEKVLVPFPIGRYIKYQEPHPKANIGHSKINWDKFIVAWTSIILGTLFLLMLAALWYLLRAAKRLKQKMHHNPAPAPPPAAAPRAQDEVPRPTSSPTSRV